jgi:protoheme ferro-lyase
VVIGAWTALLLAGIAVGASLCAGLVVPRRALWVPAATGTLAVLALALSTALVWRVAGRIDSSVAGAMIGIGAAFGGFALTASLWPPLVGRLRAAPVTLEPGPPDDIVRVILLADAEPEDYSPAYLAAAMSDLEESEIPVPPEAVRTFFYAQERGRYRRIGTSPARPTARAVAVRVSSLLFDRGFEGHASVAYCSGDPSLADALADGVRDGGRRFVVAQLAAADSRETDRARRDADRLELPRHGVEVLFTAPLWSAAGISEMLAHRVLETFDGAPPGTAGVVLVASGQPWQWDRTHPAAGEHATFLVQRVRAELVAAGMDEDRVRMAWLEWDDPGVTEVVRHLAALGCDRVLVVPATLPLDTVVTLIDLRAAASQAATTDGLSVGVLEAWGDDPAVAAALSDRIVETAKELGHG